jgi:hypothetical protein
VKIIAFAVSKAITNFKAIMMKTGVDLIIIEAKKRQVKSWDLITQTMLLCNTNEELKSWSRLCYMKKQNNLGRISSSAIYRNNGT